MNDESKEVMRRRSALIARQLDVMAWLYILVSIISVVRTPYLLLPIGMLILAAVATGYAQFMRWSTARFIRKFGK